MIKYINLGIRFVLELCLLAILAAVGLLLFDNRVVKWVAFAGLPILAATIWGLYIAPKAQHRLEQPHRLIVELILFGSASFLLYRAGYQNLAVAFIAVVFMNETLVVFWKQ